MAAQNKAVVVPSVMWAQRNDKIFITFNVEDCPKPTIEVTEKTIKFRAERDKPYNDVQEVEFELYGEIKPESKKLRIVGRHIEMVLWRKEEGEYWPRLLSNKSKMHWLKTDFEKWRDEDEDTPGDTQNEWFDMEDALAGIDKTELDRQKMMSMNGGPGGPGDFGVDEDDSDDEELPDLE